MEYSCMVVEILSFIHLSSALIILYISPLSQLHTRGTHSSFSTYFYPPLPPAPPTHLFSPSPTPYLDANADISLPGDGHRRASSPSLAPQPACPSSCFPFCFSPSRNSHRPRRQQMAGPTVACLTPSTSNTLLAHGAAAPCRPGHGGWGSGVALRLPLTSGTLLPKAGGREAGHDGGARGTTKWHGASA